MKNLILTTIIAAIAATGASAHMKSENGHPNVYHCHTKYIKIGIIKIKAGKHGCQGVTS